MHDIHVALPKLPQLYLSCTQFFFNISFPTVIDRSNMRDVAENSYCRSYQTLLRIYSDLEYMEIYGIIFSRVIFLSPRTMPWFPHFLTQKFQWFFQYFFHFQYPFSVTEKLKHCSITYHGNNLNVSNTLTFLETALPFLQVSSLCAWDPWIQCISPLHRYWSQKFTIRFYYSEVYFTFSFSTKIIS